MQEQYTPSFIERFWRKVDRSGDCWIWRGNRTKQGYGVALHEGRRHPAHRIAYEIANAPVAPDRVVRHKVCNNPPCCNPSHLEEGTQADNMRDRWELGRYACGDENPARKYPERLHRGEQHWTHRQPERIARGDRSGSARHPESRPRGASHYRRKNPERGPRGERIANSKLTAAEVRELRAAHAAGGISQAQLAARYSVTQAAISSIIRRRTWGHVL